MFTGPLLMLEGELCDIVSLPVPAPESEQRVERVEG